VVRFVLVAPVERAVDTRMKTPARRDPPELRAALALFALVLGCYQSHGLPSTDGGPLATDAGPSRRDAGRDTGPRDTGPRETCDLSAVTCTALPDCLGDDPAETIYCDDVRICLASDPGDAMATAIAAVADRIRCMRADSCDFLCFVTDGGFDDEVRSELCAITRVAPRARIECATFGP
jgi:hypothetical protein